MNHKTDPKEKKKGKEKRKERGQVKKKERNVLHIARRALIRSLGTKWSIK